MKLKDKLTLGNARRIALSAQGLDRPRGAREPTHAQLRQVTERTAIHQIDSVNVLARAHYLPFFSRLGPYPNSLLDEVAWGRRRKLFEFWAHEASLLPFEFHPLLRWRMEQAERGEGMWTSLNQVATSRRAEAEALLRRIEEEGPLSASDFHEGPRRKGWWEWSDAKRLLEWLFWAGKVTTSRRRTSFERVYDLSERVIPEKIMALPVPDKPDAQRELLRISARALGIGTASDLRDYFRLKPQDADSRVAELVEEGELVPVAVEGWRQPAYVHRDARSPRRVGGQALLAPFDPMIWERSRTERLFGMRYRIEIYTPAPKRVHGYYVLPFLLGERLVARVDLKADRQARLLRVQGAFAEPNAPPETAERLKEELRLMAQWLGLDDVEVEGKGDLALRLRAFSD